MWPLENTGWPERMVQLRWARIRYMRDLAIGAEPIHPRRLCDCVLSVGLLLLINSCHSFREWEKEFNVARRWHVRVVLGVVVEVFSTYRRLSGKVEGDSEVRLHGMYRSVVVVVTEVVCG